MMEEYVVVHEDDVSSTECADILFNGLNEEAKRIKGQNPMGTFCFSIKNSKNEISGGITGITYYGCLYIDMLWIDTVLRGKGWGTQLMQSAETHGRKQGCRFTTVTTMDWEALPFYQKLGYAIEFVREGYENNSTMYFLRKDL